MKRVVAQVLKLSIVLLTVVLCVTGYAKNTYALSISVPKEFPNKRVVKQEIEVEKVEEQTNEPVIEEVKQIEEVSPPQEVTPVVEQPIITGNMISIPNILQDHLMKDNDGTHFYLNHNLDGIYDGRGVPYIDYRTDFNTRKTIIYSHSSLDGNGPFQVLQNYHNNKSFYDNNRFITISYEGNTYQYEIFSVYVSLADSEESEGLEYFHRMTYSDTTWEETIQNYKNHSEYETGVSVSANDKIIILQTCSMDPNYYEQYYRYNLLIMAKRIN